MFDPAPWDGTTHQWKERLFLTDTVRLVLHMPVGMASVIRRMIARIEAAGAMVPDPKEFLILAHHPSPWKAELHIPVTKPVPDGTITRFTGTFFSKVFEGAYRDVPKWLSSTEAILAARGSRASKLYVHYAYCPKCARKYGRNYGVVFAELA